MKIIFNLLLFNSICCFEKYSNKTPYKHNLTLYTEKPLNIKSEPTKITSIFCIDAINRNTVLERKLINIFKSGSAISTRCRKLQWRRDR